MAPLNSHSQTMILFESVKCVNGKLCHVEYHNKRANQARKQLFGINTPLDFSVIQDTLPQIGIYRIKIEYAETIKNVSYREWSPEYIKTLKIVHADIKYPFKYLDREQLNYLHNQRGNADDVLIIVNDLVTETTIANIIVWDGRKWYTPDTPLLPGTTRERLIQTGSIIPRKIHLNDLKNFKQLAIINAIRGIQRVRTI